MIRRIDGNETTKKLIGNIINDFRQERPSNSHVDYDIYLKNGLNHATLLTDENAGNFRNVSILYFNGIMAAIGNKTGNILIQQKPRFISENKVLQKICDFLSLIQPENLKNAKKIERFKELYNNKEELGLTPDFISIKQNFQINKTRITKSITGDNNRSSIECVDEYKTL